MTIREAKNRVISTAQAEVGYRETGDNQTKYAQQYSYDTFLYGFDMDGSPWCDYFVDWVFMQAFGRDLGARMLCQSPVCSGASCAMSAQYFKNSGRFFSDPEVGDQIFFYSGGGINHTGIVESLNDSSVVTIEGNSSDAVKRNAYSRSNPNIAGYGRPEWSLAASDAVEPEFAEEESPDVPDQFLPISDTLLRKGATGPAVTVLQASLNYYFGSGYLDIDSEFGKLTDAAVRDYQKTVGIETDGIVGRQTWAALMNGSQNV